MDETNKLTESIIAGIREKKGRAITIADLTSVEDTICRYFIICQADTSNQLLAVTDSVREVVREQVGQKPMMVDGEHFAHWIVMDYGDVIVHLFVPELRKYYNIEHLWADAVVTDLPDLD